MQRGGVQAGQVEQQRDEVAVELDPARVQNRERAPDAAFRQLGGEASIGVRQIGHALRQQLRQHGRRQRPQVQAPAARPDRRQEAAGGMSDQNQHGTWRRLLQDLQQGILGASVHVLRAVCDHDAPAALGGRESQEGGGRTHVVDDDLAAQLSGLRVHSPSEDAQVRVAAARDPDEDGMAGVEEEAFRRRREEPAGRRLATRQ